MKKLLIAALCLTTFTLTACDKKPADVETTKTETTIATPVSALSSNVPADIKTDLEQLQTLSNAKAQEALSFQADLTQAAQTGEKKTLDAVVDKMDTYVDHFNDELDALKLKSSEATTLREKMKESNDIGLDLAEEGIKAQPDMNKINELQKKAIDHQQSILKDIQDLQSKIKAAT